MKLFVATDIHGSAYFAERVVQKFKESDAELLVLLGDVYNHGPRNPFPKDYAPMRVAELLNSVSDRILAIQGNCDSEVDGMISNFAFVKHNVLPLGCRKLFLTHGHVYNKDNLPPLARGDVIMYGHFHVNEVSVVNGVYCVNLSSASLPKDVSSYAVVDENGITIYDFDDNAILTQRFN